MNIKQFFAEEDAVSPVIGVILMVAITVILAAVIGTFVLGLGDQVQETAPQASFTFDYDSSAPSITVAHDGGDTVKAGNIKVTGDKVSSSGTWDTFSGGAASDDVSAGSSISVGLSGTLASGDTIRVTWTSSNGDNSATLGKFTFN